jgi:hypothetical protein
MLETHLRSPVTRERLRSGPAANHVDAFADWLHSNGFKPTTIDCRLRSLAGWKNWMLVAGFTAQDFLAEPHTIGLPVRLGLWKTLDLALKRQSWRTGTRLYQRAGCRRQRAPRTRTSTPRARHLYSTPRLRCRPRASR